MKRHSPQGFTIIEVVLVLAIAGLIFLIVFLALPTLQRSSRDAERKQAADQALALLEQFRTNNGRYPITAAEQTSFNNNYHMNFYEPNTGNAYNIQYSLGLFNTHKATPAQGQILYTAAHWCAPAGSPDDVNGDDVTQSAVVVLIMQEVGTKYCVDNHGSN
jgi:prepilin-type N-terminal cleavage/methylation domain-containing protein